jgi:hypothetical protein
MCSWSTLRTVSSVDILPSQILSFLYSLLPLFVYSHRVPKVSLDLIVRTSSRRIVL